MIVPKLTIYFDLYTVDIPGGGHYITLDGLDAGQFARERGLIVRRSNARHETGSSRVVADFRAQKEEAAR